MFLLQEEENKTTASTYGKSTSRSFVNSTPILQSVCGFLWTIEGEAPQKPREEIWMPLHMLSNQRSAFRSRIFFIYRFFHHVCETVYYQGEANQLSFIATPTMERILWERIVSYMTVFVDGIRIRLETC